MAEAMDDRTTVGLLQTLVDKEAIRELLSRYLFLTDFNNVTERAELFTEFVPDPGLERV